MIDTNSYLLNIPQAVFDCRGSDWIGLEGAMGPARIRPRCRQACCIVIYSTWWHLPSKPLREIEKIIALFAFGCRGASTSRFQSCFKTLETLIASEMASEMHSEYLLCASWESLWVSKSTFWPEMSKSAISSKWAFLEILGRLIFQKQKVWPP